MAGKTKKQGNRPQTPMSPKTSARGVQEAPLGHLGLKSGPYAPTDSKLTSQYMVRDHLVAHYKKLSKAKAAVDTGPPKAWLYSQKVRDRARRQALKSEIKRRDDWVVNSNSRRPVSARPSSRATSEIDRDEMFAMMASLNADERGMDEFDGLGRADRNTTMEVNISSSNVTPQKAHLNDKDMKFVDKILQDNEMSPGQYTYSKPIPSNIPAESLSARSKLGKTTPRDPDLMSTQAHRYTSPEKPFTPRTLKTTQKSKLSEFKYYNPPKKRPASLKAGSVVSRPETPMTDSVDLMNETLMSRDMNVRTPSGVPPLDISLDADHMKWLKDQAQKAQLRATYRTRSDIGSEIGSTRGGSTTRGFTMQRNGADDIGMVDTQEYNPQAQTLSANATQNMSREEELKYLEFITDVTNDVLDRGIFTNRVLKQVFNAHIDKHKDHLKISKMRSMLEDLRVDLGIPVGDDDDDESFGMSTQMYQREEMLSATSAIESHGMQNGHDHRSATIGVPHKSRRSQRMGAMGNDPLNTTQAFNAATLPHLRQRARGGGEGRPPLPRPGSRGSRSRPGSACSNTSYLQDLKELKEEEHESPPLKLNGGYGRSDKPDILTIEHEEENEEEAPVEADETDDLGLGFDEVDNVNGDANTDDMNKTSEFTGTADFTTTQDSVDYSEDRYEDDDTLIDEPEPVSKSDVPRPEPRKRSSITPRSEQKETPRSSQGQTYTSESVTVSELDDEENVDW